MAATEDWDEDEDELDEGEEGHIEQVCDVICPHCKHALQIVLAPSSEDVDELDDDEGV